MCAHGGPCLAAIKNFQPRLISSGPQMLSASGGTGRLGPVETDSRAAAGLQESSCGGRDAPAGVT